MAHLTESLTKKSNTSTATGIASTNLQEDYMQTMKVFLADNFCVNEKSPVSGRLKGLFFCANLFKGQLPNPSPYGKHRLQVPVEDLLANCHLYFADFYCIHSAKNQHYVVLVAAKEDSDEDTGYKYM